MKPAEQEKTNNIDFGCPSASNAEGRASMEWDFDQPWLAAREEAFQPGRVRLSPQGALLCFAADLVDDSARRTRYPFNYSAFTECDAFEIFLYREGDAHYHELHVTPTNSLLQLRLSVDSPADTNPVDMLLFESTTEIQACSHARFFFKKR